MSQTRVQLIGDSFDNGATFDGTVSAGKLSTPEIKVDSIINESGTGPIELKEGAILPPGKNLSGDGGIVISGDASFILLSAVEIGTDKISDRLGTGPVELKEGGILPVSKTLSGDGSINISGNVSTSEIQANTISNLVGTGPIELKEGATLPFSKILGGSGDINISGNITGGTITGTNPIKVDKITNKLDNGPVELKEGATLPAGKTLSGDGNINITGDVTIGGTLTYDDVTNVDSIGFITTQKGFIAEGTAGISTFRGAHFDAGNLIKETINISSNSFDSNNDINLDNGMIDYRSSELGGVTTLNLTCGVSVDNKMSIGEAITVNAITAVNNEANYINGITIDGAAVNSLNWTNEIPSDGGSSGVDVYTFTILKTGDAEFLVIGNQTKTEIAP